jgi:hypothetical protein
MNLSCKFNQRPSKSYTEELQKRISELEDQLRMKELEKPDETTLMEQKYKEMNARLISRAARLCKLSSISDILSVFTDAIGPNLHIQIPYKGISDFLTDNNQARVALMNMILASGSELMGDSPRALLFENEALSKSSHFDDKSYFHLAILIMAAYNAVHHAEMKDADNYANQAINIGRQLLSKESADPAVRMLLWKALEMKISWSSLDAMMPYLPAYMELSTTSDLPLFDQYRAIMTEVGMMAQDTMKKRKVFAYKIHAPKLDMVEQGLDNLSPLLRSESLIRLLLTRAWCYFCAHMYSEAERCVDQGIELCLQMRSRTRWSIYTLAAMFTAHQIYLCNHADQKAAAMLEMFKEASQTSGWARLCLQNISAYMSGYPMAPFFDKIIITDIMNDFGIAVPAQTNNNSVDYNSLSSSPDSSSGNNSSINNSIPEHNNSHHQYAADPAQPPQYVQQHYNTAQPSMYNENFNANYAANVNTTNNNHHNHHQPNVMYITPHPQPSYPQYSHHINNSNHGSHYS